MAKIKPRVKVPKKAAAGEIVEIKALISHPMHTCLLYTSPSPRDDT